MHARQPRFVLVETSHPGNIGGAARAMKTMGFTDLALVRPRLFPCAEATARAAGADDVLAGATVVDSLADALCGCVWVVGTSARSRSLDWPVIEPRVAAATAAQELQGGSVAIVFGRERNGLTNEELGLCHALLHIPANPEYCSLNLASAVQLIAYELHLALRDEGAWRLEAPQETPASTEDLEGFFAHLQDTLIRIGFLDADNPRLLMPKLRRLYNKARPTPVEVNILRGILTETCKFAERNALPAGRD